MYFTIAVIRVLYVGLPMFKLRLNFSNRNVQLPHPINYIN